MLPSRRPDHVVDAVAASVFVQFAGATAVLPMLPLYLRREHTSVGLVGVVMAAFFIAGVLTQYAAGRVSDRVGHRRVMLVGLATYAVSSLGFLGSFGPGWYVALRALQGLGAGALQLAGLALVGLVVPLERRGRAFARVFSAQLTGMAIGPIVGSAAGLAHIRWFFVISAGAAAAGMVPLLWSPPHAAPEEAARPDRLRINRGFVGVVVVGLIGGVITGVYETCWSLLMTSRHAAQWQIGLSWTMFAASFAAFSPLAGRLVDRVDRRHLAIAAMAVTTGFLVTYPFLTRPVWLIALGTLEAVGVAIALPAAQSLLSQLAPASVLGRAQGVFTTAENAAIAVAAGVSGYLFAVSRPLPFLAAAAVAAALTLLLPLLWRGVVGHAKDAAATPDTAVPSPSAPVSPARHVGQGVADATARA